MVNIMTTPNNGINTWSSTAHGKEAMEAASQVCMGCDVAGAITNTYK